MIHVVNLIYLELRRMYYYLLQVLKLKEQLNESEKEIQRLLLERCDGVSSNYTSPSAASSFSMEPLFLGEFGMEGLDNVFYAQENNYVQGLDWVNLYI